MPLEVGQKVRWVGKSEWVGEKGSLRGKYAIRRGDLATIVAINADNSQVVVKVPRHGSTFGWCDIENIEVIN